MTDVRIDQVTKYFGEMKAINQADIHIKEGEFFTLLGPSGCGKTTLLRALAGFYRQDEGNIYFGDQCVNDVPAHERNIGMVFQSYAIFPHMSVFDNVAYGLKARKVKKPEIQTRVMEALEMVELAHLKDRQPSQMSGGQQQRIALARAIVIHPGLLLMDEPLSNLDAKLRLKMRSDIRELQKRLHITTVYVTHDQEEALAVSDRIAVLNQGEIQQIGKPHEIYLRPVNKFVANFIGSTNFLEGELFQQTIKLEGVEFPISIDLSYEGKVIYSVRPEQIRLKKTNSEQIGPLVKGIIKETTFLGEKVEYKVELASGTSIHIHEHAVSYRDLMNEGETIELYLNPEEAIIYSESGEEALNLHGTS
ncbi:ABC transporter ATP-binding protein [Bacillus sp. FJAT-50079]|uniref:ABC transporter ATP-binding protein n=1 Tax=Bacillus sp. FJAT-50079 TaxID=2833577 RepID=UPI001BC9708A|nr:ABC transporter ATP-binding protein [Bacillus sp. FJAT-50079]MBS4209358.1 ABC transporter ATP-binding protein [Bacillus sp. FJAT-50079]